MYDKWIIVTPTLCQGDIPAWFESKDDGPETPMVFDSLKEAQIYLIEEHIEKLNAQLKEFKFQKEGTEDDIEWQPEDFIIPCTLHDDGVITTETHDPLYDPKTFVR